MTSAVLAAPAGCVLAGIATATASYLRRPDDWLVLRLRVGGVARKRAGAAPVGLRAVVSVAGTAVVAVMVPNPATQVAVLAGVAAALFAATLRRQAMARQHSMEFRDEISRVLGSIAAELRAGVDPLASVRAAAADAPAVWEPVRTAAAGDVVHALQTLASRPGGDSLAEVAAAWHLADQTGSPLATVLERMASAVRGEVELDREVAVEAAPARATGRLLAVLPLAGLGLGMLLGANPVRVLVATGVGVACLIAGLSLACLGVWRIERIVAQVEAR
jgi:tight adherence protein B